MLYHVFNNDSKDKLPIKIQAHLWQQLWDILHSDDEKSERSYCDRVCTHLERLLHQNRIKELQSTASEVYLEIKNIPRWIFLKGSVPYVIQCTTVILERLGPTAKPTGPILKLLNTLHWLLLQSYTEFDDATTGLDLSTIELFIQNLIPCMPKLNDVDVTSNSLWLPLRNHLPPGKSLLAIPVVSVKGKTKPVNQSSDSLSSNSTASDMVTIATYFDVALMKVMMLENWSIYGYKWGLQYLQYYLQNILLRQGFEVENCSVLKAINKITPTKNVPSSPTSISSSSTFASSTPESDTTPINYWQSDDTKIKIKVNDEVPEPLLSYVNPDGTLKLSFFLELVKKLVKNEAMFQLARSLLFVLEQLVEVSLDDQHLIKTLINHYPSLLYCQINIIKMFGCEHNCGVGIKCVKGENFRYLAHEYLKRLLSADVQFRERAKIWFQTYAENEDLSELLQVLHSLFGFCDWQPVTATTSEEKQGKKWYLRASSTVDDQQRYLENRNSNEKLIIDWVAQSVYKKISRIGKSEDLLTNNDFFTSITQLTKFVKGKYENIFRRLLLSGILNSFTKSSPKEAPRNDFNNDFNDTIAADGSNGSPMSWKGSNTPKFSLQETSKNGSKNPLKKKIMTMMHAQKELDVDSSFANTTGDFHSNISNSLPQDLNNPLTDTGLHSSLLNEQRTDTLEKYGNRGKTTNLYTLYHGLKQFRSLLNLAVPGTVPDEVVVAAMLDLEGPVLARAAYLMELAYFVHRCNKDDWPALLTFLKYNSLKGYTAPNILQTLKHQAGVLFHRWGVAVGKKLEDIINDDETEDHPINLLYQGEKDNVSSYCPHSLRFAACQLLKEITSYLRETHASLISTFAVMSSDSPLLPSHLELRDTSSSNQRRAKQSIANSLSKKIMDVKRRKSSVHLLAAATASNPEGSKKPASPTHSPKNVYRFYSTGGQSKANKSPKFARRFSRQASRTPLSNDVYSNYGALHVDDQETVEFPWLNVLILMNKCINFLCVHGGDVCPENCPLQQMKSCNEMMRALKRVYEHAMLEVDDHPERLSKGFSTKPENTDPVYKYLCEQVGSFYHVPFSVLCKGVFVMEHTELSDTMAASWEVLLYPDEQLKSAAACLFLVAGWRLEASTSNFLTKELTCDEPDDRAKAIQRFGVLWECQNAVYNHLELSTKNALKVPLPKLDYTMPSRMIGENPDNLLVPDAPWDPEDELMNDFDLSDDEVSVYFYDSEKQKKLKLRKKTKKLKQLKEAYTVLSVPLVYQASLDSWMPEEEDIGVPQCNLPPVIQPFFPPAMCHGILHLIRLLDDTSVAAFNSQAVSDVAYQMVWKGLVDNPNTFFRRFFEKITKLNKQEELVLLLRKLLFHMPILPGHAASALFNNLVGIISYYDRTRRPGYQERMSEVMPLLWQIVASVPKMYFTDLKQSLRREHIDNVLMVTANVGCVKDLIVHHTGKPKETLNVMDEMTFKELLSQVKQLFEVENEELWLVDKHSGVILENNHKIRDVYVFKRGFPCPVLKLEELDEDDVIFRRQQQAKTAKQSSLSQLMLTMSIFDVLPNKKHVMFLYSELYHQSSFPRRAIDIEIDLCQYPELGKEILGLDAIFKDNWIRFIAKLMMHLSELHTFDEEMIGLFLHPINGAILLYCEDVMVLRTAIAALINVAKSYGKKFANDGYYDVLPTIFRVYSSHENNMLVKEAMEFAVSKFYRLHGSPFILQMFASAAPILMTDDMNALSSEEQADLIPARCLFAILESLEREIPDKLDIMSLVQGEKPIHPYDNVLDQLEENKLDLSIRLALTIIAYRSESSRALQMMFVLSAIIPYYLKYLESATEAKPEEIEPKKKEKRQIKNMIKYVATIIEQNETLVHSYRNEGSITSDNSTDAATKNGVWGKITNAFSAVRNWFSHAGELIQEGDELERACIFDEDGENPLLISKTNIEEKKTLEEYYQPRTVLLTLASEFTTRCTERYTILQKDKDGKKTETKFSDIVEEENALILIDVAMSLLKLVFYDHSVLTNPGLQRFLLEAMPSISWLDNLEAFTVIVKRMNRIFNRCLQKPEYVKYVDWDGLEILIRGVYLTLKKDQVVAGVEEIHDLVHTCTRLIIGDFNNTSTFEANPPEGLRSPSAPSFNTTLIKLTSKLLSLRPYEYNLQENFSCYVQNVDHMKVERFLVHWMLPLCIRMGTGRYDMASMGSEDIYFVITVLMTLLSPDASLGGNISVKGSLALMTSVTVGRQLTVTQSLSKICFLGFKILLTVFTDTFGKLWKSLRTALTDYMDTYEDDFSLWMFVSHIVCNRSPILMHLLPVIRKKLLDISKYPPPIQRICQRIKKDLVKPPIINGRALVLQQLLNDLSALATSSDHQVLDTIDETDDVETFDLESPPRSRRPVEEEEDDATYIQRVKTEMRKSGRDTRSRYRSSKDSIMKRRTTPKEHAPVRKQVSFQQENEDVESPSTTSRSLSLSSPKKMMKLSKRKKLFRQKPKEEEKEDIIQNETVHDHNQESESNDDGHDDDDGEMSDDSQGKLVLSESPTPRQQVKKLEPKSDSIRVHKILSEGASKRKMFFTGTTVEEEDEGEFEEEKKNEETERDGKRELNEKSESSNEDEEFTHRKTLSLSRSAGMRRHEPSSLKISGLSFDDDRKRGGDEINRSRPTSTKSLTSNEDTEGVIRNTTLHEEASESSHTVSTDQDLHENKTKIEETKSLPIAVSQHKKLESSRSALSTQRKMFLFDHLPDQSAPSVSEDSKESSRQPGGEPTAAEIDNHPLSSTESVPEPPPLTPRSPRSPKPPNIPTFEESRIVELKRRISEDTDVS